MKVPLTTHESERLAALKSYQVLDSAAEQSYDDIAAMAAHVCQVPIALVSLVDEARQWFKAKVGWQQNQTPREVAFCAHAMLQNEPFVVRDAVKDKRFAANPLVTHSPFIRFYAGFPLVTPEGHALGTLCVLDQAARRLSAEQLQAMQALARQVMALLENRRVLAQLAAALEHIKTLQKMLPVCGWCNRIHDGQGAWNEIETYMHDHADVNFSHSICPECLQKVRPDERFRMIGA